MVINRLQLAKGGKEYICNLRAARAKNLQFVNFEAHAKSMGANGETVKSTTELEAASKRANEPPTPHGSVLETHGYAWRDGTAFWESPTSENPTTEANKKALQEQVEGKKMQRKGV